ncbi:MAG: tyrosine--tRNA ligase [Candidatus Micrarchaeota archaeon]
MDVEEKIRVFESITQELVTKDELRVLLETKPNAMAYDGFEPSGLAHLPVGIYRPLLLKQLLSTGVSFTLYLADSFAWINEKAGGDLDNAKKIGDYYLEVWRAAGLDLSKINVVWASKLMDGFDYWKTVLQVARNHTEKRTKRVLTIAGRSEDAKLTAAQLFYPSMQAADIFQMNIDICQLGMDQRKASMLAREIAPAMGRRKPIAAHHKMLLGLDGASSASFSDEERMNVKMSKSKPSTCIFVHDSEEEITKKISKAYCPEKVVEGNPILEYAQELVFRAKSEFAIHRPAKFGGDVAFHSYKTLEHAFAKGEVHPADLKAAVASEINALIHPVRNHFESNARAKRLLHEVRQIGVTR